MNTSCRRERVRKARHDAGNAPRELFGPDLSALVRFRDPATGNTWNGFGRPPNWIRGQDRERFRVR